MKLPWSFRIRQAWEILIHGTDTRYDGALVIIHEQAVEVVRLEDALKGIAKGDIVPPMMAEQAWQLMQWQDNARKALKRVMSRIAWRKERCGLGQGF
jgi:hypothetical protein